MADEYSLVKPLADLKALVRDMCENPGWGKIEIEIVDNEVKYIIPMPKHKY